MDMKKITLLPIIGLLILLLAACEKKSDYYYAEYLNEGEIALPGKVDSLQILPGYLRAKLRFKIGPDRRVTRLKIKYNTSLSSSETTFYTNVTAQDYGNYKEVEIDDLPEVAFYASVLAFDAQGDSSNVSSSTATIYGPSYRSFLANRIFNGISLAKDSKGNNFKEADGKYMKQIEFVAETAAPLDPTVFYPMQRTVIIYPTRSGGTDTLKIAPQSGSIFAPGIADKGTLTYYTEHKPFSNALDVVMSDKTTINF
jgi:hypothetical protein